jgi:uncharacterized protein YdcH (DUF465 family)
MAGKNRAKNSVFIDKTGETLATVSAVNAVNDALTSQLAEMATQLNSKVTKVEGKGLSTNDYTDIDKIEVTKVKDKADKLYVDTIKDNLNDRIDNIIATPTTVSEQEIIDARQGKASLGANLTAIKDDITQLNLSLNALMITEGQPWEE